MCRQAVSDMAAVVSFEVFGAVFTLGMDFPLLPFPIAIVMETGRVPITCVAVTTFLCTMTWFYTSITQLFVLCVCPPVVKVPFHEVWTLGELMAYYLGTTCRGALPFDSAFRILSTVV